MVILNDWIDRQLRSSIPQEEGKTVDTGQRTC